MTAPVGAADVVVSLPDGRAPGRPGAPDERKPAGAGRGGAPLTTEVVAMMFPRRTCGEGTQDGERAPYLSAIPALRPSPTVHWAGDLTLHYYPPQGLLTLLRTKVNQVRLQCCDCLHALASEPDEPLVKEHVNKPEEVFVFSVRLKASIAQLYCRIAGDRPAPTWADVCRDLTQGASAGIRGILREKLGGREPTETVSLEAFKQVFCLLYKSGCPGYLLMQFIERCSEQVPITETERRFALRLKAADPDGSMRAHAVAVAKGKAAAKGKGKAKGKGSGSLARGGKAAKGSRKGADALPTRSGSGRPGLGA